MNVVSVISPIGWKACGSSTTQLSASCGNRSSAGPTKFWTSSRNASRTRQTDVKSSSRQGPFQATPPDSFGLEANTEAIGIAGQSRKWKDGCVRLCSNISKTLPKKSSFRRPLKAREINAVRIVRSFKPVASNPSFLCGRSKWWASPPKAPRHHQRL
jgi:hypothetical protein